MDSKEPIEPFLFQQNAGTAPTICLVAFRSGVWYFFIKYKNPTSVAKNPLKKKNPANQKIFLFFQFYKRFYLFLNQIETRNMLAEKA
ncbi:hypothetical protein [Brucella melitensis]|uniref:hypothetical protein n=1 Tax=Brucella melitensis TaxID=29459 RepID=UPI00398B2C09